MKPNLFIILLFVCSLMACNNPESKEKNDSDQSNSGKTCYAKFDRDTIQLSLLSTGDSVSGTLRYKLFQKDENNGSIHGNFRADTLFGEYVFQSEGMQSIREIVFLRKNGSLIQGIGPVEEQGNRQYFTDYKQIRFDSGIELKKSGCPN